MCQHPHHRFVKQPNLSRFLPHVPQTDGTQAIGTIFLHSTFHPHFPTVLLCPYNPLSFLPLSPISPFESFLPFFVEDTLMSFLHCTAGPEIDVVVRPVSVL
mmetsp:Transcript_27353/g.55964  ORF Transcript_27353/g.55964 Transcript_27353/m.55964 type:complete len:101 (+) Transcript_27353:102-404(+)